MSDEQTYGILLYSFWIFVHNKSLFNKRLLYVSRETLLINYFPGNNYNTSLSELGTSDE